VYLSLISHLSETLIPRSAAMRSALREIRPRSVGSAVVRNGRNVGGLDETHPPRRKTQVSNDNSVAAARGMTVSRREVVSDADGIRAGS